MASTPPPPPLYTALADLAGWTLDRTASFPKSSRFTFGQRLDQRTFDALELAVRARFAARIAKPPLLDELNLLLEQLRVLWRLSAQRGFISAQQLQHVIGRIDEAGRMTGSWRASLGAPQCGP
jgi:hypothetical protein